MRIVDWNQIPIHWRLWHRPLTSVNWHDVGVELTEDEVNEMMPELAQGIIRRGEYCFAPDGNDPNK